jgi:hypothetical protein
MESEERELRSRAMDEGIQLKGRVNAIEELGRSGSSDALATLLKIGERQSESDQVLRAVGSALAVLTHQGVKITEFEMRNLQGVTYDAYCEWEP